MKKTLSRGLAAASTLALGAAFVIGTASTAQAVETWTITSLSITDVVAQDVNDTAGDDGGFLAPTQEGILLNNDNSGYLFDLTDLAPIAATDSGYDDSDISQVSDLKANVAYELHVGNTTSNLLDEMVELDQQGNLTTNVITIAPAIDLSSDSWFLMSGFGYIALWDYANGDLYTIAPDGTSTQVSLATNVESDFTPAPQSGDSEGSSYFMAAGVAQFDGTDYWFTGFDVDGSISEYNITGGNITNVLAVDDNTGPDADTFNISTCSNKWYAHGEDGAPSFFGADTTGMSEPAVVGDGVFSSAGTCASTPDPELPNTGVDAGAGVAFAALLAGLGAVAFIVRRRLVASK